MKTTKKQTASAGSDRYNRLFAMEELWQAKGKGKTLPKFALPSFGRFSKDIRNPGFPCEAMAPGYWRGLYRYGFISDVRSALAAEEFAEILVQYLDWLKSADPKDLHLCLLIVLTEPTAEHEGGAYSPHLERFLVALSSREPVPGANSNDELESSSCFRGDHLFISWWSASRSGNDGGSTVVIQPRDVFDGFVEASLSEVNYGRISNRHTTPASSGLAA